MMIDILNKLFLFLFFLAILNVVRNGFFLIRSVKQEERFSLDKNRLLFLGISISYILLMIIDGVKL